MKRSIDKIRKSLPQIALLGGCFIVLAVILAITVLISMKPPELTQEEKAAKEIEDAVKEAENDPESAVEWEYSDDFDYIPVLYDNTRTLSCSTDTGYTVTVGTGAPSATDALYLNPSVSFSGHHTDGYGVYIRARDMSRLGFDSGLMTDTPEDNGTYMICDRTYDELIPCGSGITWTNGKLLSGEEGMTDTISLRIVDFASYSVVGAFSCEVAYSDGSYRINALRGSDVAQTEDYTAEQRLKFISTAIDYLVNPDKLIIGDFEMLPDRQEMIDRAVVEKAGRPYFGILLDSDNLYIRSGTVSSFDVIAVTLPTKAIGPVTVYLVSELQFKGYSFETASWRPNVEYIAFGHDLLCPVSRETLIIPPSLYGIMETPVVQEG